jgi:hypothetical protein
MQSVRHLPHSPCSTQGWTWSAQVRNQLWPLLPEWLEAAASPYSRTATADRARVESCHATAEFSTTEPHPTSTPTSFARKVWLVTSSSHPVTQTPSRSTFERELPAGHGGTVPFHISGSWTMAEVTRHIDPIIVQRDVVLRALEWLKPNLHKDWTTVIQTPQRDTLSHLSGMVQIGDECSDLHWLHGVVAARHHEVDEDGYFPHCSSMYS